VFFPLETETHLVWPLPDFNRLRDTFFGPTESLPGFVPHLGEQLTPNTLAVLLEGPDTAPSAFTTPNCRQWWWFWGSL
jgi:hypothetical protein